MRLYGFDTRHQMRGFLHLREVFSCISNGLKQVHLSDEVTIRTTRWWANEDCDKCRPTDREHDNGESLSSYDGHDIHDRMKARCDDESDKSPEYEDYELGVPHDPGRDIFLRASIYPA